MTSAVGRDMSVQAIMPVSAKGNAEQTDNSIAFADSMQQATQGNASNLASASKNQNTNQIQDAFDKVGKNANRLEENSQPKTENKPVKSEEETSKAVDETKDEMKKKIAEDLGVSEEDVEAALEQLGLTWADLMQNGNMALLVGQLTGTDALAALTDEMAFAQISELTDFVEQSLDSLAQELGIEPESLAELLTENAGEMESLLEEVMSEMVEEPVITVDTEVKNDVKASSQMETDTTPIEVTTTQTENVSNRSEKKESSSQFGQENQAMNQMQQADATQAPVSNEDLFGQPQEGVRAQEIIDQIADYVKIHRSEQITEMEIELNPASLGNVHLQVASKDGIISAQMIAQNEAVKAALESQLLQLRESLETQGLKVTEVEVTVASHQFEENLDQQGQSAQQEAMANQHKNPRRILNLDQVDEEGQLIDGEELTQAEKLQVEMMRMGGNKLNLQG